MKLGERTAIFKALGHPARLAMLDALGEGELCVCKLAEIAGGAMPTVSRHLAVLKSAGVIEDEKRGKNVYYRLKLRCVAEMNRCLDRRAGGCSGKGTCEKR